MLILTFKKIITIPSNNPRMARKSGKISSRMLVRTQPICVANWKANSAYIRLTYD